MMIGLSANAYYLDWTIALTLSAIGVFSPIVVAIWRKTKKRNERIDSLYDLILGKDATPENPIQAPGLFERLDSLEKAVESVKKEVTPNGGRTNRLGDRVRRIEQTLDSNAQES